MFPAFRLKYTTCLAPATHLPRVLSTGWSRDGTCTKRRGWAMLAALSSSPATAAQTSWRTSKKLYSLSPATAAFNPWQNLDRDENEETHLRTSHRSVFTTPTC